LLLKFNVFIKLLVSVTGLMFLSPCWALQLVLSKSAYQGDMVVGRVLPPTKVFVGDKSRPVSSRGYFVIGVPRSQKTDILVVAKIRGKKSSKKIIRILAYQWRIQRINGLPKRYVNPQPEALNRIKEDSQRVQTIRQAKHHPVPLFLENGFIRPVKGPITGVFGSQRILNEQPRSPHQGVDFSAPLGAPVYSPADGIVRLVANSMYLMGNTLMIDHGLGVRSIFIHLDSISAKEGDQVEQGQIVARVGKTGRSTGPHLHWGISVDTTAIDPIRLLKNSFFKP
jgi:murein DD-endopeptidase MepM/ murein hydrolase activator NlpD